MPPQPMGPNLGLHVPANATSLAIYHAPTVPAGIIPNPVEMRVTMGTGNDVPGGRLEHEQIVTVPSTATAAQPLVLAVPGPATKGRILRIRNLHASQSLLVDAT